MASHLESVPVVLSAADAQFLLAVDGLFPPEFLQGATVLLASYDPAPAHATIPARGTTTA